MTRILVVGSGGREAAMVRCLANTPGTTVYCAPGNAGIAEDAECVPIVATDIDGLLQFALEQSIGLTVVGPEAPLVAGIVDLFREEGLLICGPTEVAAQITEGSKVQFKNFLARHDIDTAPYGAFNEVDRALEYIRSCGAWNIVIKADGLMGGKGVFLPVSLEEAEDVLTKLMVKGEPGETVVIERRLIGPECSVMAVTDGSKVYMLPDTRDYKREGDNDKGRNTGGMGAYTTSLPPEVSGELQIILEEVIDALSAEGCAYSGFIYLGFILTDDGPMILECNCRLGDPETQAFLSTEVGGIFLALCMAAAKQDMLDVPELVQEKQALCLVIVSGSYPDSSSRDDEITGLDEAVETGAIVFHAGTAVNKKGAFTTNKSGRVLDVVGVGASLEEARRIAYAGAEKISFSGMRHRSDIGAEASQSS